MMFFMGGWGGRGYANDNGPTVVYAQQPNGGCCCNRNRPTFYIVNFNANVALAEGATVEPISVAIAIDGVAYPLSEMDATPAAVGNYTNISVDLPVPILNGCCQNVAIQNTSAQPITLKNALIVFNRPDLNNR